MAFPEVVTREEWLEARKRLLAAEKEHTRGRDALNAERRRLPSDPGVLTHLRSRDTAFALVSRAPLAKLQKYQASRGWTVPWYSSHGSDFNYDFQATLDRSVPQLEYNFRAAPELLGGDETATEASGVSCFLRDGAEIFHTYSTYARGTDVLGSAYTFLDLTALGRQEDWEEPRGRAPRLHGADPTFTD